MNARGRSLQTSPSPAGVSSASDIILDADTGHDVSDVVARLREDIVMARYTADEPLRFRALSDAYGASVSTLREALARLTGECLVEFKPNHGFRVATVSVDDLLDINAARSEIEGVALRRSIECGDDDWEAEIVATHHRLTRTQARLKNGRDPKIAMEWEGRHRAFHQALIAGCKSRWLLRFCEMLRVQSDRYRHQVRVPPSIYPRLTGQHRPLMEATLARDADAACHILAAHFEESARVILDGIDKPEARGRAKSKPRPHKGPLLSKGG